MGTDAAETLELRLAIRALKDELHSTNQQLSAFLAMFNGEDNEDLGIRGMVIQMWQERRQTHDKADKAYAAAFGSLIVLLGKILYDSIGKGH